MGALINNFKEFNDDLYADLANDDTSKLPSNARSSCFYVLCKQFKCDGVPTFRIFCKNIFYVGMGSNGRCYQYFNEALDAIGNINSSEMGEKISVILECWNRGEGIYVVSGFHSSTRNEALNRESLAIRCIGLENLANKCYGTLNLSIQKWS